MICERLFYNISSNIEPIEFLCGNKNIDVADNLEEGERKTCLNLILTLRI